MNKVKNSPGSVIMRLMDKCTVDQSGADGDTFNIQDVKLFISSDNQTKIIMFELDVDYMFLVVKIVGKIIELSIRREDDSLDPMDRIEIADQCNGFLFGDKSDPDPNNWRYDDHIEQQLQDQKDWTVFDISPVREIYGEIEYKNDSDFAVVVEYNTTAEVDNPSILVLEEGEGEDGGVISLYPGRNLQSFDLDIF